MSARAIWNVNPPFWYADRPTPLHPFFSLSLRATKKSTESKKYKHQNWMPMYKTGCKKKPRGVGGEGKKAALCNCDVTCLQTGLLLSSSCPHVYPMVCIYKCVRVGDCGVLSPIHGAKYERNHHKVGFLKPLLSSGLRGRVACLNHAGAAT